MNSRSVINAPGYFIEKATDDGLRTSVSSMGAAISIRPFPERYEPTLPERIIISPQILLLTPSLFVFPRQRKRHSNSID